MVVCSTIIYYLTKSSILTKNWQIWQLTQTTVERFNLFYPRFSECPDRALSGEDIHNRQHM